MAWGAPRTWADGEIPTAAQFNADIKGNFDFASTHVHSGAAGDGSATLGPITYVDFTDATAPAAPSAGRTRLYTVSSKPRYRPTGGSDTGFADDGHTHTVTDEGSAVDDINIPSSAVTADWKTFGDLTASYGLAVDVAKTIGGAGKRAVVVCGVAVVAASGADANEGLGMELRRSTTQLATRSVNRSAFGTGDATFAPVAIVLTHLDVDVAAGSTTYDARFKNDGSTANPLVTRGIRIHEVSIP